MYKITWINNWKTPNIHTLIQVQYYKIYSKKGPKHLVYIILFGFGILITKYEEKSL